MYSDLAELLETLIRYEVRFLLVGGHAMGARGMPRYTGDMDIWIKPDLDNACRTWNAGWLRGASRPVRGGSGRLGACWPWIQIRSTARIDILTQISGIAFDDAWNNRIEASVGGIAVPVLGLLDMADNKEAAGREKDLADAATIRNVLQSREQATGITRLSASRSASLWPLL